MSDAERRDPVQGKNVMPRPVAVLLGLAGATVVAFGMHALRGVLAPVLVAGVLVICAHPLRVRLERHGVPSAVATLVVAGVLLLLVVGFVAACAVALLQFGALIPAFGPQLAETGQRISSWYDGVGFTSEQGQALGASLDPARIATLVGGLLGGVSGTVTLFVVLLTTMVLAVLDDVHTGTVLGNLAGPRPHLVAALAGFARNVRRYMIVTAALGAAQGAFNWMALLVLGVPGAFLWGVLSFLCSFIPNIGYFIAIVPPLVLGLLAGGWPTALGVVVVYGVINAVVQTFVQTMVVGDAVQLHQSLTFVSVLVWTAVIGPVGAVLAVPLTLLVRAVLIDADPRAAHWRAATGYLGRRRPPRSRPGRPAGSEG